MTPARSQSVLIRLPDREDLHARVDTVDAVCVTLVLAVPPEGGVPGADAVVEWVSPTGIHRIEGALAPDTPDSTVLRLHRRGEEVVQRREWARVDAVVPVDVRFEDERLGLTATVTLNVSGGGALIHDPVGVPMGCGVRIEMHLDGSPITAHGRVVREAAGGAKGVELDAITESDRERIVRFVTDRQRAQMRLRRTA